MYYGLKNGHYKWLDDLAIVYSATRFHLVEFSWWDEYFYVLKSLRYDKSIVITKPDKGIVLLNDSLYVNKMIILDVEKFTQFRPDVTHNKTKAIELKFQKTFMKLSSYWVLYSYSFMVYPRPMGTISN